MSRNPNIDAFDSEAEVLARLFPAGAPSYIAEMRPFLSRLKLTESESGTIVELGCSAGNLMQAVLEVFPAARVVGVDGAARLVEIARGRIGDGPRGSFVISPFEALDWQALPQRCAAVIAVYALEHVRPDDRRRVFRGVHGILRSGGVFLDKEWARDTTPSELDPRDRSRPEPLPDFVRKAIAEGRITEEDHWRLLDKLAQPSTHHFMDLDEQLAALREAGFREATGEWENGALTLVVARK